MISAIFFIPFDSLFLTQTDFVVIVTIFCEFFPEVYFTEWVWNIFFKFTIVENYNFFTNSSKIFGWAAKPDCCLLLNSILKKSEFMSDFCRISEKKYNKNIQRIQNLKKNNLGTQVWLLQMSAAAAVTIDVLCDPQQSP